MMMDRAILQAVNDAVKLAVAASSVSEWEAENRIRFAGRIYEPPQDQKYVEVVFIPGDGVDGWGDTKTYDGMFRLVLHWPNNDEGAYEPMDVIASVASWFTNGKRFDGVQTVGQPRGMGMLENGTETLYPVGLRYNRLAL